MITVSQASFAKSSNHQPSGEAMLISHYYQGKEDRRKGTKKYKVTACISSIPLSPKKVVEQFLNFDRGLVI